MPSNVGIIDAARAFVPATFEALQEHQPGVIDLLASGVRGRLLDPSVSDEDLSAFAVDYVGKALAVAMVTAGMDHWAVNSRITRGIDRPPGVIGGTEQAQNYDRSTTLKSIKKELVAELERDRERFVSDPSSVVPAGTVPRGMRVSTDGESLKTQDPDEMPKHTGLPTTFSWLDSIDFWTVGA